MTSSPARGPGRPKQTSSAAIRRAAMQLFAEQGYEATTLAQVAAAAGISRTTLFSYVSAKRQLLWSEHDDRVARVAEVLAESGRQHPMDRIVAALLTITHYDLDEHDALALRERISSSSAELRADREARTAELVELIIAKVSAVATEHGDEHGDAERIRLVTLALTPIGGHCASRWASDPHPQRPLHDEVAETAAPFVAALRPLLG